MRESGGFGSGLQNKVPDNWRDWLTFFFPNIISSFAPHHEDFWQWVWEIKKGERPRPFIAIWARGGGKSTSAELASVLVGARKSRSYILYVRQTQDLADKSVENIASLLESEVIAAYYPALSERMIGKYGNVRGWRRNRLRTASGLTIDAVGLEVAARGLKTEQDRPDMIIFDDIDDKHDTPKKTRKKIDTITHSLLPAGSSDVAVVGIQNLIIPDGVFSRLYDGRADFLQNRIVSGAHPAIKDFEYERFDNGKYIITGGTPTWSEQNLEVCQQMVDDFGISAFLSECQHEVEPPAGGMFDHLPFDMMRVTRNEILPPHVKIVKTVVWVDPAVTSTDKSDSVGIQADGISHDGIIFRLRSFEGIISPTEALQKAINWGIELGAIHVGVETNQGGDLWREAYYQAAKDMGVSPPPFRSAKATGSLGDKAHRASLMLADYERGTIRHVEGTHIILERALKRFPRSKPFDLVDAAFWSWYALRNGSYSGIIKMGKTKWT